MPDTEEMEYLREETLEPYLEGQGPTFTICVWETARMHGRGTSMLGYRLEENDPETEESVTLFEGEDFSTSPMNAIDSDEMLAGLMGFLTLRPGDTDEEYFEDYTKEQLEFADQHAESLSAASVDAFGED